MPAPEHLTFKFRYDKPHIVAIDDDTIYDIPTKLVNLATSIKKGNEGQIMDCLVLFKKRLPNGKYDFEIFHFGTGNKETAITMLEVCKGGLHGKLHY